MFRFSFVCALVVVCAASTCTYGQQSYPKSLLWRISGKGLKHPSYLYGTMHLTDNRLFNFGDSVYRAIEKIDGLAIEVNPDEMGAYYVNKMFDEIEGSKLQDILTDKDYKKYSDALSKKFKKPASEITTNDIVTEKNKWLNDYFEKGEMATFVDAYLYNIARRQGKWVGGVEDITDQAGLLDDLVDKSDIDFLLAGDSSYIKTASNRMMEKMVELYTNQDLAGIEALMSTESPEHKDALLIKRNVKMTRRIDSLTALRTMFIAIGAAHLPGDSGVIHLLQQKGFTVEPVYSSKKINAKNYTFKEVRIPWTETSDPQGFYKVSMPGNPVNLKLFGLLEMKYLFDVYNLSNYCTMAIINPRSTINKDSILNEMAQRMFRTDKKVTGKKVVNNGVEGKEYQQVIKGENVRLQAFMHENVVYVAFIYAIKEATLRSEDANNFFSSFNINKTPAPSARSYTFVDSVMGISFMAPAEVTYNKRLSNDKEAGWHVSGFTGTDLANGMYIFLFSKDVRPSHYLSSDTVLQNKLIEGLKTQYTGLHIDTINLQGNKVLHLKGSHIEQQGLYMEAMSLIKNNRNVVLMVITDSLHLQTPEAKKLFSSLRFIPPASIPWTVQTTADSQLSARIPGTFRKYEDEERSFSYAFDTTSASSYYIIPDTLSKYLWYKSDSLFWKNTVERYTGRDSLVNETTVENNGLLAKELLIKEDYNYKRMRLVLHDNILYQVMLSGDKEFVYHSDATAFLSSFRIHAPQQNKTFITQPKTALLLHDLAGSDSIARSEAYGYLNRITFTRDDLPLLYQALFKEYDPLYSSQEKDYINLRLSTYLGRLTDTTTISFIKEQYPSLTNDKEWLKGTALSTLAHLPTKESYSTLAQLVDQYDVPEKALDYTILNCLKDSLELTATIFPTLQKLARNSVHCDVISNVAIALRDSGLIKQEQLAVAQNDYIQGAKKLLPDVKTGNIAYYSIDDLLNLVGSFNTTAGNEVLKSYLTVKDKFTRKDATVQLIKNKQAVPASVLLKLAADRTVRPLLYEKLKELKKTALFPQQYATQQYFAESIIYEWASDDYDVQKMIFLAKKTATFKGKPYTFYLYRVILDDDGPEGYLGIAGGYKPGSTSLQVSKEISGIYWDETYSLGKINTFFKDFLKNREQADESD
ncbi:TraB/GumN family protein [Niastella caeni]|uniref:TraB/GumN family protein n=1 Tax=Niastella caeni TaxID=2569763 RepID=A0A4S8HJS0_9BACT|nr:TraB/GumN family protein [Niastella caeni]THU34861.1 TraB/GumN family protein [Niastella caeni]